MIVCSIPRCGATKFCLDLQDITGLQFIGELNPIYITNFGDDVKHLYHETKFQPNYTREVYLAALHNDSKRIALVNQSPHLFMPQCDMIVLRKNMKDAFLSLANFFIKCRPYLKSAGIIQHLHLTFQSYYGVLCYLEAFKKPIVWYEDYYGLSGTTISLLNKYPGGQIIKDQIDNMFEMYNTEEVLRGLWDE